MWAVITAPGTARLARIAAASRRYVPAGVSAGRSTPASRHGPPSTRAQSPNTAWASDPPVLIPTNSTSGGPSHPATCSTVSASGGRRWGVSRSARAATRERVVMSQRPAAERTPTEARLVMTRDIDCVIKRRLLVRQPRQGLRSAP